MKEQSKALRMAAALNHQVNYGSYDWKRVEPMMEKAAKELHRLSVVEDKYIALLQDDGKAEREIERLREQNKLLHDRHSFDNGYLMNLENINKQLLEVLKEIMSWEENETMTWAKKARAAIAAAKGEV